MKNLKKMNPKRFLCLLLTLVMLAGILPLSAVTAVAAGSVTGYGTEDNPYVVTDYDGLRDVLMNRGSSRTTYLKLGADFDTKSKADGAGITEATNIVIRQSFVLDLNGHKAELYSLRISCIFRIIYGGLTVWDSSPERSGELQGSGDVDYFILIDYGKFILNSGTVSVNLIDFRWRSVVRTTKTGQAKITVNGGFLNVEAKGIFCSTENGYGFDPQDYALRVEDGDSAEINGGTFNGRVLFSGKTVSPSVAEKKFVINGGNFKRSVYLDIKDGAENETVTPVEINGGVFEYDVEGGTRRDPNAYDTIYHMQFAGMKGRAVFKPGTVIYAQGNSRSEGDEWYAVDDSNAADVSAKLLHEQGGSVFLGKNSCYKSPITVIPNAYGIKNVSLNGASVRYTHNSPYAPVYDVRRNDRNTLVFSWYDLPEKMKEAGYGYSYSYRLYKNNVETVSVGTVTPVTQDGVSSWTHTVPADSTLNSYVVYLRLDLMKDGKLVNTAAHDEYIVRLNCTDNIVDITETKLTMPNGDLKPDIYYGKPGESNIVTVPNGMKYSVSSQTDWSGTLADNNHFKSGNVYTKTVVLKANTGYRFSSSCAASLNGAPSAELVGAEVAADGKFMTVSLQATCVIVLRTASGTLTGFEQGKDVWKAEVISAEPEKYDIEIVYIGDKSYGTHNMSEPTWFGKDCNYAFGLKVVPKAGYGFLESGYGTVTLTVKMDDNYRNDIQTVTTSYTTYRQVGSMSYSGKFFETEDDCWAPPQTFDRLHISVKEPVAGESADGSDYRKAIVEESGFTVTEFYWQEKGSNRKFTGTFEAGKVYFYNIRVEWQWYMMPVMKGRFPQYTLYINGEDNNDWAEYDANNNVVAISACDSMTAAASAPVATVYGAVKSFGSQTDEVIVQLFENSASEPSYETVVKGNNIGYFIENVALGTYTVKVTKKDHADRIYTLTVTEGSVKQDLELWLYGDVTFDGNIDITDAMAVFYHVAKKDELSEEVLTVADFDFNGTTDISDAMALFYFVAKKTDSLFG